MVDDIYGAHLVHLCLGWNNEKVLHILDTIRRYDIGKPLGVQWFTLPVNVCCIIGFNSPREEKQVRHLLNKLYYRKDVTPASLVRWVTIAARSIVLYKTVRPITWDLKLIFGGSGWLFNFLIYYLIVLTIILFRVHSEMTDTKI